MKLKTSHRNHKGNLKIFQTECKNKNIIYQYLYDTVKREFGGQCIALNAYIKQNKHFKLLYRKKLTE